MVKRKHTHTHNSPNISPTLKNMQQEKTAVSVNPTQKRNTPSWTPNMAWILQTSGANENCTIYKLETETRNKHTNKQYTTLLVSYVCLCLKATGPDRLFSPDLPYLNIFKKKKRWTYKFKVVSTHLLEHTPKKTFTNKQFQPGFLS